MNYLKGKRIIRVKACHGRVQMFKNMRLVILFYIFLNPTFKMTTSFVNTAKTKPAQVNLYARKDFKSLELGSVYEN